VTTSPAASRVPAQASPSPDTSSLEVSLAAVELAIATLGHTLSQPDIAAIETASTALHEAMRAAMNEFAKVARRGAMPVALRNRFAMANGQIAAQREALFRATSMVEQNLEILIPRPMAETSVYSASGANQRGPGRMIAAS
jgi:phospholipase/lecithinase/hemolysin